MTVAETLRELHQRHGPKPFQRQDAQLTQSDLGRLDPHAEPERRAKGWQERAAAREDASRDVLRLLNALDQHLGDFVSVLTAPPVADVLGHVLIVMPSAGFWSHAWKDPYQAVTVTNVGTSALTVQATPPAPSGMAPEQGQGLVFVPIGVQRTQPLRGTVVTVYGTPGTTFELTAYSRPREPQSGLCAGQLVTPLQELTIANPAAGAVFSQALPTTVQSQLVGVFATLVTAAGGGNRIFIVQAEDPTTGNTILQAAASTVQAASLNWHYAGQLGVSISAASTSAECFSLPNVWLPPGAVINCLITNLAAGDQLSNILLCYRTIQ